MGAAALPHDAADTGHGRFDTGCRDATVGWTAARGGGRRKISTGTREFYLVARRQSWKASTHSATLVQHNYHRLRRAPTELRRIHAAPASCHLEERPKTQ